MNKKILAAFVAIIMLSVSCGGEKVEKVDIPKSNDSATGQTTNPPDSNTQTGNPSKNNQTDNKPTDSSKPKDNNNTQASTETIPEAIMEPLKESQLMTAMKLIPKEAFDITTTEGIAGLVYASQESCFKRMKYDFKKNVEDIAKHAPIFFYEIIKSPRNDFENPKNWIWMVSNITQLTYWMAGDFKLNMNMTPILKNEKYKQYPLEYQYSYYLAPEEVENPRYGRFVAPLADSFAMLSNNDVASLARTSVVNITEKGSGMLDNLDYAKLLSYLGEPEACSLLKIEKGMDVSKIIDDPNSQKLPEELKKTLELIKNKTRPRTLKYVGIGFYPEEEFCLRFLLFYDSSDEARKDMPTIKDIWANQSIINSEPWRNMSKLEKTRFSVKDNIGIVECKIDRNMSGIDAVSNISILLMTNSIFPLIKR